MPANKSKSSAHPLCNKPKASNAAPAAKKRQSKASLPAPAPKRRRPVVPQSPNSSDNNAGGQNRNVKSNSESENDMPMEDLAPRSGSWPFMLPSLPFARTCVTTSNDPVLKQLVSKTRWLSHIAGMVSTNMDDIFSFGAKVGGAMIEEGSHIWKELKAGSATSEGRVVWQVANQWNALVKVIPEFVTDLKYYVKSKECFQLLLAFMAKHASATLRDNIAGLKCSIHNYIISEEPIPAGTPRNQLGLGNITTARLLKSYEMRALPSGISLALIAMSWSFCNTVTSGKKDITKDILAKNLPSFLWHNDEESDCKMFDKGFLRGKSSALQPNLGSASIGQSHLIKVHKARRVKPGMIVWAAAMARFSLSSDMWDTIIRLFNSDLELGNPEWACDTLQQQATQAMAHSEQVPAAVQADRQVKKQAATTEAAIKEAKRRKAQAHDEAMSQAEDGFEPEATPPRYNSVSQGGKKDFENTFGLLPVYSDIGDQADFESYSVSAGSGSNSEHSNNSGNEKEYGDGWP
ncbi:hypothetical protein BC835DRAFT_1311047 [Cytidiella melzeri]|nr:hypothetical protein BC835DRAFT_1311047 [Cytidiella melzeri]